MPLLSSTDFFQNYFFKKFFQKHLLSVLKKLVYIRVNVLFDPDLGPNCLQRLLEDNKVATITES